MIPARLIPLLKRISQFFIAPVAPVAPATGVVHCEVTPRLAMAMALDPIPAMLAVVTPRVALEETVEVHS